MIGFIREKLGQTDEKIGEFYCARQGMVLDFALGRGPYEASNGRAGDLAIRAIYLRLALERLERREQQG